MHIHLRQDQKILSSSLIRERLHTYDALLDNSSSVLLLVVIFTMTPSPVIDGSFNFF